MDRKATERVYAGGKDTKRDEDGIDSPIWKRKGDVHDLGNDWTETVGEGF